MLKVKLWFDLESETSQFFYTEMPKIPNKGDNVGFWYNGEWDVRAVDYITYEFDKNNKYLIAEISLIP